MKKDEKEFIKGIIASDLKNIPNQKFTVETVSKIRDMKEMKMKARPVRDFTFLYPVMLYTVLLLLASTVKLITVYFNFSHINLINEISRFTFSFALNPVVVSTCVVLILLYKLDLYLKSCKFLNFLKND